MSKTPRAQTPGGGYAERNHMISQQNVDWLHLKEKERALISLKSGGEQNDEQRGKWKWQHTEEG